MMQFILPTIFCYPCISMENNNLVFAIFAPNIGDSRMGIYKCYVLLKTNDQTNYRNNDNINLFRQSRFVN